MAKATEITVDVHVKIPDDTICRCLRILEMWMDDNPDKRIVVDQVLYTDGYKHKIRIKDWSRKGADQELEDAGFEL